MSRRDDPVVVKVGGSLLDLPGLSDRLARFLAAHGERRLVLIVGGGGAADWVRALDRSHGLGEARSHALAVRALDLTARALAAIVPGLEVAEAVIDLAPIWARGRVPVLAPRLALEEDDRASVEPLPRSWDVTTDAIAARLAVRLGAGTLILLKSATPRRGSTRTEAARGGLVDPAFPGVSRPIAEVLVVNLRAPEPSAVRLEVDR